MNTEPGPTTDALDTRAGGNSAVVEVPVRSVLHLQQSLLSKNDRFAAALRQLFQERGIGVVNMMSSPGSGKTTLLQRTIAALGTARRAGVIVGDLATDNDAKRLAATGAPVVQIETGTLCHLEADMVSRAAQGLGLDDLDLLFIENVGNLVCPAGYDLGEASRVVLLSVTEGEDKPLKYPTAFHRANIVVVTKIDLAEAVEFDRTTALENIRRVNPTVRVFEVSARTGAGLDAWCAYLAELRPEPVAAP
jgi:hydrogenase nickel incorporation protein HypB